MAGVPRSCAYVKKKKQMQKEKTQTKKNISGADQGEARECQQRGRRAAKEKTRQSRQR